MMAAGLRMSKRPGRTSEDGTPNASASALSLTIDAAGFQAALLFTATPLDSIDNAVAVRDLLPKRRLVGRCGVDGSTSGRSKFSRKGDHDRRLAVQAPCRHSAQDS